MKRCPTCGRTYTEEHLSFCIEDGTPLTSVPFAEDGSTVVSPSASHSHSGGSPSVQPIPPQGPPPPPYVPPGSAPPPPGGGGRKRAVWPWVLGGVAVLVIGLAGLGIVAAIVIPSLIRSSSNRNTGYGSDRSRDNRDFNFNRSNSNNNTNSDMGSNSNTNSSAESVTPPPTDAKEVLAALESIENEWTVANINADKKALDRILADDYVATSLDGRTVGKAEYISTIERDRDTQRWEFKDLKVDLKGNRATLTGTIRFHTRSQERAFQFTDTFVWREDRWQATGSEIKEIPAVNIKYFADQPKAANRVFN